MNKTCRKIFYLLGALVSYGAYAASNFYVQPPRIILKNLTNSGQLTVYNTNAESQLIQVKLKSMLQEIKNNKLTEVNPDIMGDPQVIITPMVLTVAPKSSQVVRFLPLSQQDNVEIEYRAFVNSITKQDLKASGTTVELGFGIPVYVLPKNIKEELHYSILKTKTPGKYSIKIENKGNVHENVDSVTLLDKDNKEISIIDTPGGILPGKYRTYDFTLDNKYQGYVSFKADIKVQDLINFTNSISNVATLTVVGG